MFQNKISADEIIFDTAELNITNNSKLITAGPGSAFSSNDNIKINAQSFQYNKKSSILTAINGSTILLDKNINIKANKFIYYKKLSTLVAQGNVVIKDLTNNIIIDSKNITYQRKEGFIKSEGKSSFVDSIGNKFFTNDFFYTLNDNLIKISNAKMISTENDVLNIEKAYVNLLTNKLIGKDISIDFNKKNFNENNDPRLKGKTISSNKEITIIEKGIFTSCKKNDDCPPWQFLAKKIRHDKKKKTINYEGAWLKIYDKPVFYFPKFFHPDPTVKRQSGFLMPSFIGSNTTGSGFTIPYFHAISDNKDFTITPRIYATNKILAQSEYRVVNDKSKHKIDFSVLNEKNDFSKNHFFSDSHKELDFHNFDETILSLQLQRVSGETYLKKYKLESPLINDTNTLTSSVEFSTSKEDFSLNVEFTAYENLGMVKGSDKYEYIYPNFSLVKGLKTDLDSIGNLNLNSSGYIKNYNTNVFERVLINDFLFSSHSRYSNDGFKNNFNVLLKNINTKSKNSENYNDKLESKIVSLTEYNSSYPLQKKTANYTNIIKPVVSVRYSPDNSKNYRDNERRINVNNIFSLNRIGVNDSVEGGGSLSFGTEYSKIDNSEREIVEAKIANVIKLVEDRNLPSNSSLGKKTSDIVGSLSFNPNDFLKFDYEFSQDENLKDTNYQLIKNEFRVNNFITTFEYLNENNTKNDQGYLSNTTVYNFDDTKSFKFETRENKKTKATEFYNIIYEYKNDCLVAAMEYNKDYYTDRDLKPDESIFLKLSIIPFGQTKTPNLKK